MNLREAADEIGRMAVERLTQYGPKDARGAALWDCSVWLDEHADIDELPEVPRCDHVLREWRDGSCHLCGATTERIERDNR